MDELSLLHVRLAGIRGLDTGNQMGKARITGLRKMDGCLSCANAIAVPPRDNAAPKSAATVGREASQRGEAELLLDRAPRAVETHLARPAPEMPLALLWE